MNIEWSVLKQSDNTAVETEWRGVCVL